MGKYPLLMQRLVGEDILRPQDLLEPVALGRDTLELVHTAGYLDKLEASALTLSEVRRLGIPWSDALWRRSRLASAGTLLAARQSLIDGVAGNLAGGTHHAFADHAEGFCVLNDVAIAIRRLQLDGAIQRAAIIDLDVHQGNGTAAIFDGDAAVFTFSMHGQRNYPSDKMRSTLDVGLANGTGDVEYLRTLASHLPTVLDAFKPDLVFYLAGVDIVAGDRYGKLAVSESGLRDRDRMVIDAVRARMLPLTIVLGGGYAADTMRTVELHAHVFREAVRRSTK